MTVRDSPTASSLDRARDVEKIAAIVRQIQDNLSGSTDASAVVAQIRRVDARLEEHWSFCKAQLGDGRIEELVRTDCEAMMREVDRLRLQLQVMLVSIRRVDMDDLPGTGRLGTSTGEIGASPGKPDSGRTAPSRLSSTRGERHRRASDGTERRRAGSSLRTDAALPERVAALEVQGRELRTALADARRERAAIEEWVRRLLGYTDELRVGRRHDRLMFMRRIGRLEGENRGLRARVEALEASIETLKAVRPRSSARP